MLSRVLPVVICLVLAACTGADHVARTDAALESDVPPPDFALAVTVHVPERAGTSRSVITPEYATRDGAGARMGSAYSLPSTSYGQRGVEGVPLAVRPARYIVQPDWVLRAAIGVGARVRSYPPETRQLSAAEVRELYLLARDAGIFDTEHPGLVPVPPQDPFDRGGPGGWHWDERYGERDTRTKYIVSYALADARRTVVIPVEERAADALPSAPAGGSEGSEKVARLVETLGRLSWQREAPAPTAVEPAAAAVETPVDSRETK